MRRQLSSVFVVLLLFVGIMVVPGASVSASGLVVEPDASAPVGVEAFVRGVVPDGASGVRTQVSVDAVLVDEEWVDEEWVESEVGEIGVDGAFEIVLSFGDDAVGEFTYRVVADTTDGEVFSEKFVFVRTAATDTFDEGEREALGAAETSEEPVTPEDVDPPVDAITVTASHTGSRPVGVLTRVWGNVIGATNGQVFTEVLVEGEWTLSETTTSDGTGYYQIPLSYGANTAGTYTYRVGAVTDDTTVYSDPFEFERTALSASVTASSAGSRPVGTLTRVWGTVTGATNGQVFTEVFVAGRWSRSQVTTSDATGYYQIPLTYGANTAGTYTWRVGAAVPGGTVYSQPFEFVRTAPTATVSASSAGSRPAGTLTRVWGRVTGHTEGRVFTEVLLAGGWSRSQVTTSDATGYYQIPLTYGANTVGTLTWRVGADTPDGRVYSAPFDFTRTPRTPPRTVMISDSVIAALRWSGNLGRLTNSNWETYLESCRRLVAPSCSGREGFAPRTALNQIKDIRMRKGAAGPHDLLVIATGYNDSHARFRADFGAVNAEARAAGFRQIVWLTYRTNVSYSLPGTGGTQQSSYALMNSIMVDELASGAWPEVSLWDYATYTAGRSSWFSSDGVHLTATGARAIADWLSVQVAR